MRIRVGVLFGGASVEHEISIITAIQAMNSIDNRKYEVIPIYIAKDGTWYSGNMLKEMEVYVDMDLLKRYAKEVVLYRRGDRFILQNKHGLFRKDITELDICLPIMHGTSGEDGNLQGYLETVGIPYCEADTYAAVVGQDKIFMKQIWESCGVPIVKYDWFYDNDYNQDPNGIIERLEKMGYPLIVKPARLGSSVGIAVCKDVNELKKAISDAISYDIKVLVEKVVENLTEVNISVLGNYQKQQLSVIEEVGTSNSILTYEDKYVGGTKGKTGAKGIGSKGMASAKRIIPARISDKLANQVRKVAIEAYRSLNATGVVRIDFLIDTKNEKVYANEINSIPGSLSFYLWNKTDKEYPELLDEIINLGIREYKNKTNKVRSFDTNILSTFARGGAKGMKGIKGIKK